MDKEQRYEVDKNGKLVIDVPHTTTVHHIVKLDTIW